MRKFLSLALLLVVGATALAGCGGQLTAPEIIQHLKDTAAQTQDLHMVVNLSGNMTGTAAGATSPAGSDSPLGAMGNLPKSGQASIELWYKQPNLVRAEIRSLNTGDATGTSLTGATVVDDGTTLWAYDPSHKTAYKLDVNALKNAGQVANLPVDVQGLLSDPNLATVIDRVLSLTDASVAGTEKVGTFDTYKMTLQPKADTGLANAALGVKATMWVDQATWTVVKLDVTSSQANFNYVAQSVDFNKGVPADTFKFTLPAGAKAIDLTMFIPRPVTLDQATKTAAQQGFTLLSPGYTPTGSKLTSVMQLPVGQGFTLSYSGAGSTPHFTLTEGIVRAGLSAAFPGLGDKLGTLGGDAPSGITPQTVTVRGVAGKAYSKPAGKDGTAQGGTFLTWQEKNSTLRISLGGELSQDEALKIANGLK